MEGVVSSDGDVPVPDFLDGTHCEWACNPSAIVFYAENCFPC